MTEPATSKSGSIPAGASEDYLRLLRGEINSKEYVEALMAQIDHLRETLKYTEAVLGSDVRGERYDGAAKVRYAALKKIRAALITTNSYEKPDA